MDDLSESMKLPYELLINIYAEIEQEMMKEGKIYCFKYIKEKCIYVRVNGLLAIWLNNNYKPTIEEYLHSSTTSVGYSLLAMASYIGMGYISTENIFKWATIEPKIFKAAAIVCRLMDDIVSNEFEQKREHVSSFLKCYMDQYGGSKEAAICDCRKRIINAWKNINEECLIPTDVPMPFLTRILNLTRFIDVESSLQQPPKHKLYIGNTHILQNLHEDILMVFTYSYGFQALHGSGDCKELTLNCCTTLAPSGTNGSS
ncbi:hypothetical protein Fmac_021355 [Flemingia macrophylla]|uniref:Terpene synthase metal-binding domain-containing protein n=1 Tax=Flemingia macrophylla TaxID=520843 RepID=A0ABD1LWM4_9FABA